MCENLLIVYFCMRCSNDLYKDEELTPCQLFENLKPCGKSNIILSTKCEPALCTLCSSFPPDSQLPFMTQPQAGSPATVMRQLRLTSYRKFDTTEPFTMCKIINTTRVCSDCRDTITTDLKRDKCSNYGTVKCKQENIYITKTVSASRYCPICPQEGDKDKDKK
ncbi:hypothetical protein FBEOM_6433 [Fusarium beomiforme]|uniref:Uncharacterized protein n=1 Tax=Fusarium beomiforme TaxID=44412 RepID=A0A9P5AJ08_9HYPO|nr:hypothetical protein FBEOM_6433 [Fusarium beomiforme]